MSINGDYAAFIVHDQRSRDLQAEARRDGLARQARAVFRRGNGRKAARAARAQARATARSRARTA
ncbi:hypothetical protein [Jiangella mangrovi]|uniref:Uncharacterized protein n=1 Tax=Jiangella mangrovi TaxID=1524084 RepID=A0A7W9GL42_9ACTN|nr:hypothetical protein [Jiangella mangrovi]MBB5785663.1 hypothetical protein [Jiangella mangrovi]